MPCPHPSASTVGGLPAACATDHPTPPSRLLARMSPLLLRAFPFYSAGRVRVQPAAEPRNVQRHKHGGNVCGALCACPGLSFHCRGLPAACATNHPAPPGSRLLARISSMRSLFTRQGASAFNQPLSLDTSRVTDMALMFYVRSARALPSASTVRASLLLAPPTTPPHPAPASLPACRPSSYAFPSYSAGRVGVQPAAELRHVQRHSNVVNV